LSTKWIVSPLSKHGRLSGRYQGGQLNEVGQGIADILGGAIQQAPEEKGGKDVTVSFAKPITLENKRGSVTGAQKAGRGKSPLRQRQLVRKRAQNGSVRLKMRLLM
jgi:hypothetical protein